MNPKKITTEDEKLIIDWNDNKKTRISFKDLRKNCPCATCITEREKQSKDFIRIYNQSQISIKNIEQVGSYAIKITWKDGHSTGIYEYSFLRRLSDF
ncbi:MAG: DUF971 domain-containing protein [Bacteroidetes bacterium]|nr:DUF971 domain-containing protein [Bacteroidota bacterium]MCH8941761.1 DUF971 domain-containing protein [Bacteroidota bacterium]